MITVLKVYCLHHSRNNTHTDLEATTIHLCQKYCAVSHTVVWCGSLLSHQLYCMVTAIKSTRNGLGAPGPLLRNLPVSKNPKKVQICSVLAGSECP